MVHTGQLSPLAARVAEDAAQCIARFNDAQHKAATTLHEGIGALLEDMRRSDLRRQPDAEVKVVVSTGYGRDEIYDVLALWHLPNADLYVARSYQHYRNGLIRLTSPTTGDFLTAHELIQPGPAAAERYAAIMADLATLQERAVAQHSGDGVEG